MDTVFGGGVEELTREREAKKQANIQAILNQRRKDGNYDALGAFGTRLGTNLGDKLGEKIFGDPEMDKAKSDQLAVEAIRSQYEPNDPRFGYALSDLFRKRGDMKTSISLFNQAKEQEKSIAIEKNKAQEASEDVLRNKTFADNSGSSVIKDLVKNDPNMSFKDLQDALTQEQSTKKEGSVVIGGKTFPAFIKGGRLFSVNPDTNKTEDISTSGLAFKPFSTSVTNNYIGDSNKNTYNDEFFKQRAKKDVDNQTQKAEAAATARKTLRLAETSLRYLENIDINSGVGAETFTKIKGFIGTTLREAGFDVDDNKLLDINSETGLNAFTTEYLKPFVAAQGKSFSDADLKLALKAAVGVSNPKGANKIIAKISTMSALNTQENTDFYNERYNQVGEGGKEKFASLTNSDRDFEYYVKDLPRFKPLGEGNFEVTNDGRDLHKYWQEGRPESFTISVQGKNGEFKEQNLSLNKIGEIAKNLSTPLTTRELLAKLDLEGKILGFQTKTTGSKK